MTEKIQKAIDKIDQEAEKMGSATVRLLCSHIIDHCLVNDENADKVLAEGKSHDNMEEWCTKCKPKTQIIELSTQIPQSLHDELARYCTEIAYDEERQA